MNDILFDTILNLSSSKNCESILKEHSQKNDRERIKMAIEYLMKNPKRPKISHHHQKNSAITKEKIEEAIKLAETKAPFDKILQKYNETVACAPLGSKELSLAYANRSASLCNAKYFEDSLKDINRCFQIGYPDKLKALLFVRRAKNLLGINPTMRAEVMEADANARYYLQYASDASKPKIERALDQLLDNKVALGRTPKWDDRQFLPKTPGSNSKLLHTSSTVDIKYSEEFGRHIVAKKDINAGAAISVHKAYISTLYPEHFYSYCWNCCRKALSGIPCTQCVNVIYCNESCRDKAWLEYHDIECPVINALSTEIINPVDIMALKVTIRALKERKTIEELKAKVARINSKKDPVTKSFTNGVFDDTKYASVCTLNRIPKEHIILFQYSLKAACILYYLAASTEVFGEKMYDFKSILENKQASFLGGLILRNFEISMANAIGICSNDDEGNNIKKGGQLISFQSLINHSCDPNAYQYTSGDMNAIIAIVPIKEGQQIFINYGPGYMDVPVKLRRKNLKESQNFYCTCIACENNWNPDNWITRISSFRKMNIPASVKEELSRIQLEHDDYKFPLTYELIRKKSPEDIEKTLSTLFMIINKYGMHLQEPCQEVQILKISVIKIYNSVSR